MRLWHIDLLPHLPKQWLMGQHRECCALRGKGWGKKHSTVDYAFKHPYYMLFTYHRKVIKLLREKHNVNVDSKWDCNNYRGKQIGWDDTDFTARVEWSVPEYNKYKEHDYDYLRECVENLRQKGVFVSL